MRPTKSPFRLPAAALFAGGLASCLLGTGVGWADDSYSHFRSPTDWPPKPHVHVDVLDQAKAKSDAARRALTASRKSGSAHLELDDFRDPNTEFLNLVWQQDPFSPVNSTKASESTRQSETEKQSELSAPSDPTSQHSVSSNLAISETAIAQRSPRESIASQPPGAAEPLVVRYAGRPSLKKFVVPTETTVKPSRRSTPYDLARFRQSLTNETEVLQAQHELDLATRVAAAEEAAAREAAIARSLAANPAPVKSVSSRIQRRANGQLRLNSHAMVSPSPAPQSDNHPVNLAANGSVHSPAPQINVPPQLPSPPRAASNTVTGWQFRQIAQKHIQIGESLYTNGTPLSARQHAQKAMQNLALATDAQARTNQGTAALKAGLAAIDESGDFLGRYGSPDLDAVRRYVDAHQTPVLKNFNLARTSGLQAADAYYQYAREQLVLANRAWPESSRALTMLSITAPLASRDSKEITVAGQVCLLRAAVDCDPRDATSLRKLGSALTTLGLFNEAKTALDQSFSIDQNPETMRLLSQLHRQTGNVQMADYCESLFRAAKANQVKQATVLNLSPSQFSGMSPQLISQTAAQAAATPQTTAANVKAGIQQSAGPSRNWASKAIDTATSPVRSLFR